MMALDRTLLALCVGAALLAGCGRTDDAQQAAPDAAAGMAADQAGPASPSSDAQPAADEADAAPDAAGSGAFDIASVPPSGQSLGEWPYLSAPEGYSFRTDPAKGTKDLARVPFWTGQQLVWVEGRTFESRVEAGEGKNYSRFEVLKRIDQALTALGAKKLVERSFDRDFYHANKDELEPFRREFHAVQDAYWYDNPAETYVIRGPDRVVWVAVTSSQSSGGGVLVAEAPLPGAGAP